MSEQEYFFHLERLTLIQLKEIVKLFEVTLIDGSLIPNQDGYSSKNLGLKEEDEELLLLSALASLGRGR